MVLGWWEWIALPELGIDAVKAKVDTGARTSALHAFDVSVDDSFAPPRVHFSTAPRQRSDEPRVRCTAPLVDRRSVRNSGGEAEFRPVIRTTIGAQGRRWSLEVTLTDRSRMGFRMLLGRTGVPRGWTVDPRRSNVEGRSVDHDGPGIDPDADPDSD